MATCPQTAIAVLWCYHDGATLFQGSGRSDDDGVQWTRVPDVNMANVNVLGSSRSPETGSTMVHHIGSTMVHRAPYW